MKIRRKFITLICICALIFSACNMGDNAVSVTMGDVTSPGSTDITLSVIYQTEKDYEEKYTDIMVKSNIDNLTIKIKHELEDFVSITLEHKNVYYSLATLISNTKIQQPQFVKYTDALSKNYIINSNTDCKLTFKAVVGDVSEKGLLLLSKVDASKEFTLNVKKKSD